MSGEGMDELTRDELQAGAEQLEQMSVDQFEQLFGSLFIENMSEFDQDHDALLVDVTFDDRYGIDSLYYSHIRVGDSVTLPLSGADEDDFDLDVITDDVWYLRDDNTVADGLRITSLTLVHPVTVELTPPPEKQLEYIPDWELPAVLCQIDANLPLLDLTCARQPEECERCESKPADLSGTEERQFIDRQLRQHRISDGDAVRAVAVITRRRHDTAEKWVFEDLYHWECALPEKTFQEDYTARRSVGKDEVLCEGRVTYGELQHSPVGDYYEVTLSNIEVLARRRSAV